jgi:hypothetical protein
MKPIVCYNFAAGWRAGERQLVFRGDSMSEQNFSNHAKFVPDVPLFRASGTGG